MTTDRERLELAAKAAGYDIQEACPERGLWVYLAPGHCRWWNPLTDDGDALRLAMQLNMRVSIGTAGSMAYWEDQSGPNCFYGPTEYHFDGRQSKGQATRRAIVRAAAEIGRAMP